MSFGIRRVVTGHDNNGKAVVLIDEIKPSASARPGAHAVEAWTTEGFPVNNDGSQDEGKRQTGTTLDNGTVFRIVRYRRSSQRQLAHERVSPSGRALRAVADSRFGRTASRAYCQESDLETKANDPTESLTQYQLMDSFSPTYSGVRGQGNLFFLRPVLPFSPRGWFPETILRLEIPLVTFPDGRTGLGDIVVQSVPIFHVGPKLRIGFGPTLITPSATSRFIGSGKWQLGPSVVVVYTGIKGWVIGAIAYNPISFAGSLSRKDVNNLSVQPLIAKTLTRGFYLREDPTLQSDWEHGGERTVPVNFGAGRVFNIGHQAVNAYLQPEWTVHRPTYLGAIIPTFTMRFSLTFLFPKAHLVEPPRGGYDTHD